MGGPSKNPEKPTVLTAANAALVLIVIGGFGAQTIYDRDHGSHAKTDQSKSLITLPPGKQAYASNDQTAGHQDTIQHQCSFINSACRSYPRPDQPAQRHHVGKYHITRGAYALQIVQHLFVEQRTPVGHRSFTDRTAETNGAQQPQRFYRARQRSFARPQVFLFGWYKNTAIVERTSTIPATIKNVARSSTLSSSYNRPARPRSSHRCSTNHETKRAMIYHTFLPVPAGPAYSWKYSTHYHKKPKKNKKAESKATEWL